MLEPGAVLFFKESQEVGFTVKKQGQTMRYTGKTLH